MKNFDKENILLAAMLIGILIMLIGILIMLIGMIGGYVCMLICPDYAEINEAVFLPLLFGEIVQFFLSIALLEEC